MRYIYFYLISLIFFSACGLRYPVTNVYFGEKKKPARVHDLNIQFYTDSIFPNSKIAQFHNIKSISLLSDYEFLLPIVQIEGLSKQIHHDTIKKYKIHQLRINSKLLDSIKHIRQLYFYGFYIERFPYELNKLEFLETLEVYCYNLSDFSNNLAGFKNLKKLGIGGTGPMPDTIAFPLSLEKLELDIKMSHGVAKSIDESNIKKVVIHTRGNSISLDEKIRLVESLGKVDNLKSCKLHLETCDEKAAIKSAIKDKSILKKVKLIVEGQPICALEGYFP